MHAIYNVYFVLFCSFTQQFVPGQAPNSVTISTDQGRKYLGTKRSKVNNVKYTFKTQFIL